MKINIFHSNINWIDDNNSFVLSIQYIGIITKIHINTDISDQVYKCNYKIITPNDIQIYFKRPIQQFNALFVNVEYTNNYDVIKQFEYQKTIQLFDKEKYDSILVKTSDGNILTNLWNQCKEKGDVIQVLTPPNLKYPIFLYLIKDHFHH